MTYSPDKQWWWNGKEWIPASQAPPPPKRKDSRRPLLIAGAVVLVLLFGFCTFAVANSGGQKQTAAKPTANAASQAPTRAPAATKAPAPAVADAGTCDPQPCANDNRGWIITISKFKYNNLEVVTDYEKPEQGNVFVTMNVTFINKRDIEQHADTYQFVLQDAAGVKHPSHTLISDTCHYWTAVNVTPGASFGPQCLSFEAKAGNDKGLVLVWTPSTFGGGYPIKLS